jgi:hypothetical protein
MGDILKDIQFSQTVDANGNVTTSSKSRLVSIEKGEPPYIKLYYKAWMGIYDVPDAYKTLFLTMAKNMSPCICDDLDHSQLVNTAGIYTDIYLRACHWTSKDSLKKGLKALCDCNAIIRVGRGVYQVNPTFAAKGKWLNGKVDATAFSGVREFTTSFDWANGTMQTTITTSADDDDQDVYDDED